jgi:hypothetical protein
MAFLIKRKNVYHLAHRATPDGKKVRFSTGLKTNVPQDVRRALELKAEYALKECRNAVNVPRSQNVEKWEAWLPGFIEMKYRNKAASLQRWRSVERTLRMFWKEFEIHTPRHLTRQHCFEYFKWRSRPDPKSRKRKATHNTALLEMQALGMLMKEAVHRGYAVANPCRELGIGRDDCNQPCDLSDAILAELEGHILAEPDGEHKTILWRSYLVARCHGVRIMETHVNPMRDVVLRGENDSEITFYQKGGRKRTKPLHPRLFPLFAELQAAKASELYPMPSGLSPFWGRYLEKWGMRRHGKVCFHSLRVTVQNRLRRAGVNDEIRRAYLSHEMKKDVHEQYSRIQIQEMRVCHQFL